MDLLPNLDDALSRHFRLRELVVTTHREFLETQAYPPAVVVASLARLCREVLEPIRSEWACPVVVVSGWRCPGLNAAVGSKPTSQHLAGEAADLVVPGVALERVFAVLRASPVVFGQALLEGHQAGVPTWLHVSLPREGHPNRQALVSNDGGRTFVPA